jgi:hypothetical protein
LKLDTKENLRAYLAEHSPRKRNRVHEAIRETIETEPARFITRNSGFAIAATEIKVDDAKKTILLKDASIINGAQSQGEIKSWVHDMFGDEVPEGYTEPPFFVRAEIIVDPDPQEVVETAIARNTATAVKSISQAGARGHLEELEASVKRIYPNLGIKKKETDDGGYDTRKILQYARLLMPVTVSKNDSPAEKLRAYKNPEQCLTEFSQWYEEKGKDENARRKYEFTVQIAPYAIAEYEFWERNEGWNGHMIWEETKKGGRVCRRDKAKKIIWVSTGLVFPILGAMSEFIEETSPGKWTISKPEIFKPGEMIARAVAQFRALDSDPMLMGRSTGAYDALRIYPSTLVAVMEDMRKARVGSGN